MTKRYPSFGDLGYWHLVEGAPEERAHRLADLYQQQIGRDTLRARWDIHPDHIRGMVLELVAHYEIPDAVLDALRVVMDLPESTLEDPPEFFRRRPGAGAPLVTARARNIAMWKEVAHLRQHGAPMSVNGLARTVGVSRATVKRWRTEPEYREFIAILGSMPCGDKSVD